MIFSFDDAAEEKCKENLDAAIEANPSNPEAHQLMASFWLSKEDKEVCIFIKFLLTICILTYSGILCYSCETCSHDLIFGVTRKKETSSHICTNCTYKIVLASCS